MIKACIFDLDGVIVDTAGYHYLAWKKLADELGVPFGHEDNENLKGVSRFKSLEYILEKGGIAKTDEQKNELARQKNEWYLQSIKAINAGEILPGAKELLSELKQKGIKIALGSASKNAVAILEGIGLMDYFDFISDGNSTDKSKPDPEVFLIAANGLAVNPGNSIVFEDSIMGIEAALKGGFKSVGIGDSATLRKADVVVKNLEDVSLEKLEKWFNKTNNQ